MNDQITVLNAFRRRYSDGRGVVLHVMGSQTFEGRFIDWLHMTDDIPYARRRETRRVWSNLPGSYTQGGIVVGDETHLFVRDREDDDDDGT